MSIRTLLVLIALGALLAAGCGKKAEVDAAPPIGPGNTPETANAPAQKVKVTAYINVSSGCQASTVDLVNKLGADYADLVDLEVVNFGSPEGHRRWQNDGMECMGILFDNGNGPSPALKFPDRNGKEKTVVFFMPAGFGWKHEDLEDAFAALKAGTLQILSEDEARKEISGEKLDTTVAIMDTDEGAQVLVADEPIFTVMTGVGDATKMDRANAAKEAIEKWISEPVQPSDIRVKDKDGDAVVMVGDAEVITVTAEDAKQAEEQTPKDLAMKWAAGLKKAIVTTAAAE